MISGKIYNDLHFKGTVFADLQIKHCISPVQFTTVLHISTSFYNSAFFFVGKSTMHKWIETYKESIIQNRKQISIQLIIWNFVKSEFKRYSFCFSMALWWDAWFLMHMRSPPKEPHLACVRCYVMHNRHKYLKAKAKYVCEC